VFLASWASGDWLLASDVWKGKAVCSLYKCGCTHTIFGTEYHVICIFVFMHKLDCGWSMQISWCLCYAHVRFSVSSATDLLLTDVLLIDSCLRACTVHVWQTH
jgi:hypothetical protein